MRNIGGSGDHSAAGYVCLGQFDKLSALDKVISSQKVGTQDRVLVSWLTVERDPNDWLQFAYEAIKAESQGPAIDLMQQQPIASNALAHRVVAGYSRSIQNHGP